MELRNPSPPASCPDAPRTAAQGISCAICVVGSISGGMTCCQCKQEHTLNKDHQHAKAMFSTKGILRPPDPSDKDRMPTSSASHQSASLQGPRLPKCKSLQPPSPLNTDAFGRNCARMDIAEAFPSSYGSRMLHPHSQGSEKLAASLPKEAATNHVFASPIQVLGPRFNEDYLGTESGPSSKSVCTPENGKLCRRTCNLSRPSNAASFSRSPMVEFALLRPTFASGERSTMVYPDRIRSPSPILRKSIAKHALPTPISEPKGAATNHVSPSSKQILPRLSKDHLGTKSGPSSKSVCTPENEKLCRRTCNLSTPSNYAPFSLSPIVESVLLNPTSAFGERFTMVDPERIRTPAPILRKSVAKHVIPTPVSKPKEAAINLASPSPKQVLAPRSSKDHLGTKSGPSSKTACTSENEKLCSRSCNLATRSNAAPVSQSPIVESALLSATSVLGKRSTEVYPDRIRTTDSIMKKTIMKHVLASPMPFLSERSTEVYANSKSGLYTITSTDVSHGKYILALSQNKSIPQTHRPQSPAPAQCNALSKETNLVALTNCDTPSGVEETESAKSENGITLDARGGEKRDIGKSKDIDNTMDVTGDISSDLILNNPPSVSLDVPPGFTKSHCHQHPPIGGPAVNTPPSPVLDASIDIPAGFTEPCCMLPAAGQETGVSTPVTENKPLMGVSLNVPRPVKTETEILPGLSTLLPVKIEPASDAIDEVIAKPTPCLSRKAAKADETTRMHKKAKAEEDEEPEEGVTPQRVSDLPASRGDSSEEQETVMTNGPPPQPGPRRSARKRKPSAGPDPPAGSRSARKRKPKVRLDL